MIDERRMAETSRAVSAIGVLLLLACLLLGCASSRDPRSTAAQRPSVSEVLADAPAWVTQGCRTYWGDPEKRRRVVCGVGSAPALRDRVAARETAIARARTEVARSLEVTIESLVRLEENGREQADLETIAHQLSSLSLRGLQLESVWRTTTGEVHALVSLDVDRVQKSVRSSGALSPAAREDLAQRAAEAFAALDASFTDEAGGAHVEPAR